jgi:tetratricopeptide (TPR) repeat protein
MDDDNNVKKQIAVLCTTLFLIVGFSTKSLAGNSPSSPAIDLDSTLLAIYDQYEAEKYEPALHRCNLLVQKYPLSTAAQDLKVSLLLATRKPVDGACAKATALPCKTAMDFFMAGLLDLISRQYQKSLDRLSKAIELNPEEVRFYCARARLLDLQSEQKRVIQDLNKALEIEPKYAPAHRLKAFIFRRAGNSNAALTEINYVIALSPMPADYWSRATIYGSMKKFDLALKDWNEYVKSDPSTEAYTGRAALLLKNGKLKEGLYDLDKAVGLSPKWYLPHRLRAEACLALQEPAKAVKDVEVMQNYVRDTERIGGKQTVKDRQSELSREELIKAQQISYEVHSRLGNLHAAAGDLEELLKISPHDKWALSHLQNKTEKVGRDVQADKSNGGILSTTDN